MESLYLKKEITKGEVEESLDLIAFEITTKGCDTNFFIKFLELYTKNEKFDNHIFSHLDEFDEENYDNILVPEELKKSYFNLMISYSELN